MNESKSFRRLTYSYNGETHVLCWDSYPESLQEAVRLARRMTLDTENPGRRAAGEFFLQRLPNPLAA